MNIDRNVLGFSLVIPIFCFVLFGCSPSESKPEAPTPPKESSPSTTEVQPEESGPVTGDWLVQRAAVEPPHLNVLLDTSGAYAAAVGSHIFEYLIDRNKETLEFEPVLAESFEISEDQLVYTYKIRKDAHFSDGVPVTAHDVKFTFDAVLNPENLTADLRNYYKSLESVDVLDDHTIRFTCNKPYFKHLEITGQQLRIYPRHIYGQGDFNNHPNNRKPVGSGPYILEAWDTNQQMVLKRDPNYWGDKKPNIDKIVYKLVTDDNAAIQLLERQELDLMGFTPEQWVTRASRPEFEAKFDKYEYWGRTNYLGTYNYIGWNMRKPFFSDKHVRRAMTHLLDRELILETIYHGLGRVVTGSAVSHTPEYNTNVKPWPFDPEEAARLLDKSGWVDSDKDGVRDKDGIPFKYEFMIPPNSAEAQQLATVYKEELERAGIIMEIRPLEWATFIERITQRKFDSMAMAWVIPPDGDPHQLWHSTQTEQGSNYPGFKNDEADEIIEAIKAEFDREERIKLWHRFHEILHEEQPYTFLFNTPAHVAVDKRFRNVKAYTLGLEAREWWVPKKLQRYQ